MKEEKTMNSWNLLPTISGSMPFQMALDEILFNAAIEAHQNGNDLPPILRFYYASEPWVSLGYAYAGWRDWRDNQDTDEGAEKDFPVCRRLTGGGRVIHGNDLMFTMIAPKTMDESFKSVRVSYLKIHEVLKDALTALGCESRFYRCDEDLPKGKDCFVFPIATDLAVGNGKIAGGGQKRSLGIMLHQESVQLKGLPGANKIITAFQEKFCLHFNATLKNSSIHPAWFADAEALADHKYRVQNEVMKQNQAGTVTV